jgi:translation initiation factor 3 subunit M
LQVAMAIYINNGEAGGTDDPIVQGAEWLAQLIGGQGPDGVKAQEKFEGRFQATGYLDESGKYDTAEVFNVFLDFSEDLFASIPDSAVTGRESGGRATEVESFFALALSMLLHFEDMSMLDKSTERLCQLFASSVEQQPELRLRLLMQLYNTFNNPEMPQRFHIFKHIIFYAAKANLFDQVLPYLDFLDSWMVDWEGSGGVKLDDKRTLFLDLSGYMRTLGKRVDAFLYLKRYAQLFQGVKDAAELSKEKVESSTIQLLKDALQLPSVIQFDDILAFDTVKALNKGKHAKLIELCKLFLNGDVKDLDNFHKKDEKVFKDYDVNYQEAKSKIRLLTLATKVHGKSEIALSDVAKALEESEDNVETWVVRALSEGVIDGRIDQLNHKVLVKSAFQREFGKNEWAFLDAKLVQWTENLDHVIKFIGEQKKIREGTA